MPAGRRGSRPRRCWRWRPRRHPRPGCRRRQRWPHAQCPCGRCRAAGWRPSGRDTLGNARFLDRHDAHFDFGVLGHVPGGDCFVGVDAIFFVVGGPELNDGFFDRLRWYFHNDCLFDYLFYFFLNDDCLFDYLFYLFLNDTVSLTICGSGAAGCAQAATATTTSNKIDVTKSNLLM